MKKLLVKPGFEFIFSFSLVMILGLPPVLLAQIKTQKDIDIKIENGDTTINGKNIKELSAEDRQSALTDIRNLRGNSAARWKGNGPHHMFKRRDTLGGDIQHIEIIRRKRSNDDRAPFITEHIVVRDSLGNAIGTIPGKLREPNKRMSFNYRMDDENGDRMGMGPGRFDRALPRFDHKNSQNFEYVNTDNDGVSTHVSFHVSEASDDDLKRMPYVEGPKFEVKDLNLVPQFSSGKIVLMFNLLSKAPAEVKLSDSEGKTLWNEKALGGTFSKTFALGLNGIYYLQIKQGKNISLKKIMKEE